MAEIFWKTNEEIEQEKANQPLPDEEQIANLLFAQTMTEIKLQQAEQSNANILLTLAKNNIT